MRTNSFTYASNAIDLTSVIGPSGEILSSNIVNAAHEVATNYDALSQQAVFTYNANYQLTSVKSPAGLTTTNLYFGIFEENSGWFGSEKGKGI